MLGSLLVRCFAWILVAALFLSLPLRAASDLPPSSPPTQYDKQMRSLQASFCGAEKQEEIKSTVRKLVDDTLAGLPAESREKLHADHVVDEIMQTLWTTFHVKELCLEHRNRSVDKFVGAGYGTAAIVGLQSTGVYTAIHELGHAVTNSLCWCQQGSEIHVVKFKVIAEFMQGLFSGKPDLQTFSNMMNPLFMGQIGSVKATGWTSFSYSPNAHLSSLGLAMGSNGAEAFMLLGGMLFTTIAQVSGIIIGLNIRHRHPVIGYALISASIIGYAGELLNCATILFNAGSASAGSDLVRAAVVLGVSPLVISGVMVGATAAVAITYFAVNRYLNYLREMRISARSLIDEGFLAAIKGKETNLLDELLNRYPRKGKFDRRIEKMQHHIEKVSLRKMQLAVKTITAQQLRMAEGKPRKGGWRSKLADGDTFASLRGSVTHFRQVKKFKDELKRFATYIASSSAKITLADQDSVGTLAVSKVLGGKFITSRKGWWGHHKNNSNERAILISAYLSTHGVVSLKTLVRSNVARLKFNEKMIDKGSENRWYTLINKENYKELKKYQGFFFGLRQISYSYFIENLQYDVEMLVQKFIAAKMDNQLKNMSAAAKELLKKVLLVPKQLRDIPAAVQMLTRYADAVQGQDRIHLKKRGLLDVVDEASCRSEVEFLCALGGIFHRAHFAEGLTFACPLQVPDHCFELRNARGLIGPAK